jgi:hypothetical protein
MAWRALKEGWEFLQKGIITRLKNFVAAPAPDPVISLEEAIAFLENGITKLKKFVEGNSESKFSSEEYIKLYTYVSYPPSSLGSSSDLRWFWSRPAQDGIQHADAAEWLREAALRLVSRDNRGVPLVRGELLIVVTSADPYSVCLVCRRLFLCCQILGKI